MPTSTAFRRLAALTLLATSFSAVAQQHTLQPRIAGNIDDGVRLALAGTHNPRARAANDAGAVARGAQLQGMTLVFARTPAQEADLQQLLGQLQDRTSPSYHQWLTPAQFGARFGVADSDLAKTKSWLASQGFQVTAVSNSRDRIVFSGTAGQFAQAFRTELHNFSADSQTHFAPVGELSVPAALGNIVRTVGNVSNFRPRPHVKLKPAVAANPNFTSGQTGSHFLTPKDISTIYDINAAYNAGYTGAGQTIVVIGQSAIVPADIASFQTAAGVPVRAPNLILVPNTGTSAVSSGDETESDLDLEYTSGVAKGATIDFVYTGNNTNYGVFDAMQYAIDNRLSNIISVSYGDCETDLTAADFASLNGLLAQAAAQGQTVVAASGDDGSTDCYQDTNLTLAQRQGLSADFPSDSQYVTGLGGTMLTASAIASGSTYWNAGTGSDVLTSALSYMPEQVWNNDSASGGLSSGGGGISVFTARPTWQTGVTGIASGAFRLSPDISLAASPENAGYLYCSSDSKSTGVTGSCANGFRDTNNVYLTVAGGTSFAAPVFAGMLAILNQQTNNTNGQGNINSTLYALAANSSTYASAFHDITVGSNACAAGTTYCSTLGAGSYSATTGYDSASGLGSIDLNNLIAAWPGSVVATPPPAKSFAVSAASAIITDGSSGSAAVTITPANGYTGSVAYTVVPSATIANLCYTLPSTTVSGTAAAASTLTIYTSASGCASSNVISLGKIGPTHSASVPSHTGLELAAFGFTGLLAFASFRNRKLRPLLAVASLAVLGFTGTGCGSGATPSAAATTTTTTANTYAAKGTYTLTVTGTDTVTSKLTSSTTMTLTIN